MIFDMNMINVEVQIANGTSSNYKWNPYMFKYVQSFDFITHLKSNLFTVLNACIVLLLVYNLHNIEYSDTKHAAINIKMISGNINIWHENPYFRKSPRFL